MRAALGAVFGRFLCSLLGHKDRRLRKGESAPAHLRANGYEPMTPIVYRICSRCSRLREVKTRKRNAAAA